MATKIKEFTPTEVRAAAEALLASLQAFQAAEEAAIDQAAKLVGMMDDAKLPRLNNAIFNEAEQILQDLDGSSIRDAETVLELIELAAKGEADG